MGSLLDTSVKKASHQCLKPRSKGDRLGWSPIGTSTRKSLAELSLLGGRVSGNYGVSSCKKLIP